MRGCILSAPHYTTALLYCRITHLEASPAATRERQKAGLVDAAGNGNYEWEQSTVACERRLEAKGLPRHARDAGRVLSAHYVCTFDLRLQ